MAKNKASVAAISVIVVAGCLYFAEARAIDCFSLSVRTSSTSFKLGSGIPLHFMLRNCGINTVWRQDYAAGTYADYLVSVTRENNSELDKTQAYTEALAPENTRGVWLSHISPFQMMSTSTDLRNMVHIDTPGTYHIVATTKVPDSVAGPQEVRSNTLTLVIEPKGGDSP